MLSLTSCKCEMKAGSKVAEQIDNLEKAMKVVCMKLTLYLAVSHVEFSACVE